MKMRILKVLFYSILGSFTCAASVTAQEIGDLGLRFEAGGFLSVMKTEDSKYHKGTYYGMSKGFVTKETNLTGEIILKDLDSNYPKVLETVFPLSEKRNRKIIFALKRRYNNTTWDPIGEEADVFPGFQEPLIGTTYRIDPDADLILSKWRGDNRVIYDAGLFSETSFMLDEYFNSGADEVKLVLNRPAVGFWEALAASDNKAVKIRTFSDSNYGDAAIAIVPSSIITNALHHETTKKAAYQVNAFGSGSNIIDSDKTHRQIRVPQVSLFDQYVDGVTKLEDLKSGIETILEAVAPPLHCTLIPRKKWTGYIVCQCHSSQFNYRDAFWLNTAIAFRVIETTNGKTRDVILSVRSQFDNGGKKDVFPSNDQYRLIAPGDPDKYNKLENEVLHQFFVAIRNAYPGVEID